MFHSDLKSVASSTCNVRKRPVDPCPVHRAEIDSGRYMACQAKARPISHIGMGRIDKVGPSGLLQHCSEKMDFKLFVVCLVFFFFSLLHNACVVILG